MLLEVITVERAREAYAFGLRRAAQARADGRRHRFGYNPTVEQEAIAHAESAVAELFVSVARDEPLVSNELKPDAGVDVGENVGVRWTPLEHGCLIIHEDEPDSLLGALVVGRAPLQRFVGTFGAGDAKRPVWWRTDVRNPAFFVPQAVLEPPIMWRSEATG